MGILLISGRVKQAQGPEGSRQKVFKCFSSMSDGQYLSVADLTVPSDFAVSRDQTQTSMAASTADGNCLLLPSAYQTQACISSVKHRSFFAAAGSQAGVEIISIAIFR